MIPDCVRLRGRASAKKDTADRSSTGVLYKSDGDAKIGARDQAIDALRKGARRTYGDPCGLGGAPGLSSPPIMWDGESSLKLGTNQTWCIPQSSDEQRRGAPPRWGQEVALSMPAAAGGRADSTGSEDDDSRVLQVLQAQAQSRYIPVPAR
ncbi:hypothetical protein AK812_SmicGene22583 [Symbiodinium microadriaticum]|uniref:Uncharacterized protein n=1 Tax=Symbiodinium microadriaticum TaxID=2951 RepID=A0A1Q9DJG4_SYMMI|nr:hypothetical protein AK812_SmicGene22583 [Symbiodinium microadriaticum]